MIVCNIILISFQLFVHENSLMTLREYIISLKYLFYITLILLFLKLISLIILFQKIMVRYFTLILFFLSF